MSGAAERLAWRMRSGHSITLPGARHEILQEATATANTCSPPSTPSAGRRAAAARLEAARRQPLRMAIAAACNSGVAAAMTSPPCSARSPSNVVTTPPAFSMIGISADDVVGLQPGIDDDVDMAGGDHGEGVAIGAVAGEPHRAFEPVVERRAWRP